MTPRVFGPIVKDITQAAIFTYDYVFDQTIFSQSGYSTMAGPLSLSIDVDNSTYRIVYIGVIIKTNEGIISTADRYNLAFCPGLSAITISAASVPSFAEIRGDIISITVRLFAFTQPVASANKNCTVYIRLDSPLPIVSPTPLIGRDTQALQPGVFQIDRYAFANPNYPGLTIPANTPTTKTVLALTTLYTDTNLWRFRTRIVSIYVVINATPFPGDVIVEVHYLDAAMALAGTYVQPIMTFMSETDRVVTANKPLGFVILGTEAMAIVAYNRNAARDGKAAGSIFMEIMY